MFRLCFGLSSISISLLLAAQALGLVPDREGAIIDGRLALSEAIAVQCAQAVQRNNDLPDIEFAAKQLVKRHPDVLSVSVRMADGKLALDVGQHQADSSETSAAPSSASHMRVPIALDGKPWGTIDLEFRPISSTGLLTFLGGPSYLLFIFMGAGGYLGTYFFLVTAIRRVDMKKLKVVPDRVRDTLNTIAEGVLVLDTDQRIAMANDKFAETVGRPVAELKGQAIAELPWAPVRPEDPVPEQPWLIAVRDRASQVGAIIGLQTADLGLRRLSVNATPILGDDGACMGTLVTFDDMTPIENKNTELRHALTRIKRSRTKIRWPCKRPRKWPRPLIAPRANSSPTSATKSARP
jgi:PAS domain-containing protein